MTKKKYAKTRFDGVFRREDGTWWIQATVVCPVSGRRIARRRALPADLTVEQAALHRAELVLEAKAQAKARPAPATAPTTTLAAYSVQWIERKAARLKASVAEHYAKTIGRKILPVIGKVPVAELRRADVERWVVWAEAQTHADKKPLSTATVNAWWRVLGVLLRDAAADFGIADPMRRVEPPRTKVRNVREGATLTAAQLGSLLRSVQDLFPDWHAEVATMAYTGVRLGELYALTWPDIDHEKGRILIRQSVWRGIVDDTKTHAPREVALPEWLSEMLRAHRQRLVREQHPGLKEGLVFPSSTGGHRSTGLTKVLRLAAQAAGIGTRVTPQVLRRTFNTLLVMAGVDRVVLRSQMGHTTEAMTERYAGIPVSAKVAAVEQLRVAVEGGVTPEGNTPAPAATGTGVKRNENPAN